MACGVGARGLTYGHYLACWSGVPASLWLMLLLTVMTSHGGPAGEIISYCVDNKFEAACPFGSVILIESAQYGRMRTGSCISGEGYLGCALNVSSILAGHCSGRSHCEMLVSSLVNKVRPCKRDFASYLEASYNCVPVSTQELTCRMPQHTPLLTSSSGLLASQTLQQNGHGDSQCPWRLRARKGQTFDFYLTLFKPASDNRTQSHETLHGRRECNWEVVIQDGTTTFVEALCAGHQTTRAIHRSASSMVEVYFSLNGNMAQAPVFVLNYTVLGCPDIRPPVNTTVKRIEGGLEVQCNFTREVWHLTCMGSTWFGNNSVNCSSGGDSASSGFQKVFGSSIPYPQGLIIAIILGIFLGVIIGSVSLGILFLARRRRQQRFGRPGTADESRLRLRQSSPGESVSVKRVHTPKSPAHFMYDSKQPYTADAASRQDHLLRNVYHGDQVEGYQEAGLTHAHTGPAYGRQKSREYELPRVPGEPAPGPGHDGKMYFELDPDDPRNSNRRST